MQFSIITSIYKNDNPLFVSQALDSMLVNQTIKPSEIVMVIDGPINNDLMEIIACYQTDYPSVLRVIKLSKNGGLGNALQIALENTKYELVARMDE